MKQSGFFLRVVLTAVIACLQPAHLKAMEVHEVKAALDKQQPVALKGMNDLFARNSWDLHFDGIKPEESIASVARYLRGTIPLPAEERNKDKIVELFHGKLDHIIHIENGMLYIKDLRNSEALALFNNTGTQPLVREYLTKRGFTEREQTDVQAALFYVYEQQVSAPRRKVLLAHMAREIGALEGTASGNAVNEVVVDPSSLDQMRALNGHMGVRPEVPFSGLRSSYKMRWGLKPVPHDPITIVPIPKGLRINLDQSQPRTGLIVNRLSPGKFQRLWEMWNASHDPKTPGTDTPTDKK